MAHGRQHRGRAAKVARHRYRRERPNEHCGAKVIGFGPSWLGIWRRKPVPALGSMHQQFAIPDGAGRASELRRGAADPTRPSGRSPWRMILLASLGGALELYDFVVFGVFASAIGAVFFPTANPLVSQMLAYAGFARLFRAAGRRHRPGPFRRPRGTADRVRRLDAGRL